MTASPVRSALYIPASKARAMEKARGLACDAILFDLEDAVAPAEKPAARTALASMLAGGGFGRRRKIVRINGLGTVWGADDARAVAGMEVDGILLPKVGGPAELAALAALAPGRRLWAMIETPAGVLGAAAIAAHPLLDGLVMGTNDLAKDLTASGRAALGHALQSTLLAARAHRKLALDGVYTAFRDLAGLRAECAEGRAFGFDGKTLIHPDQIAVANEVFGPSQADLELARRQIAAHEAAEAAGQGVAVLDGHIVENLHVAAARALLERAAAIAALGE